MTPSRVRNDWTTSLRMTAPPDCGGSRRAPLCPDVERDPRSSTCGVNSCGSAARISSAYRGRVLEVTRAQVLAFRVRAQQLDRAAGSLDDTAVLDLGVQDTGPDG